MPPRTKYSREDLLAVSRQIIVESGFESLTARNISRKLGSTTAPIFTCFGSMEALQHAILEMLFEENREYLLDSLNYYPALKMFGIRWVRYARENPRIYAALYTTKRDDSEMRELIRRHLMELINPITNAAVDTFRIDYSETKKLMEKMINFISGMSISVINGMKNYTDEEVAELVSECGLALVNNINLTNGVYDEKMARLIQTSIKTMPVALGEESAFPGYDKFNQIMESLAGK